MKRKPNVTDLFEELKLPDRTQEQQLLFDITTAFFELGNAVKLMYSGYRPYHREALREICGYVHPHDFGNKLASAAVTLNQIVEQNRKLLAALEERLTEEDKKQLKVLQVQWNLEQANPDAGEDKLKRGSNDLNSIFDINTTPPKFLDI